MYLGFNIKLLLFFTKTKKVSLTLNLYQVVNFIYIHICVCVYIYIYIHIYIYIYITQSFSMEILHKWTVPTNLWEIHTKICGNYLTMEIIPHQEIRRNSSSFHSASYFCLYFMSFIK